MVRGKETDSVACSIDRIEKESRRMMLFDLLQFPWLTRGVSGISNIRCVYEERRWRGLHGSFPRWVQFVRYLKSDPFVAGSRDLPCCSVFSGGPILCEFGPRVAGPRQTLPENAIETAKSGAKVRMFRVSLVPAAHLGDCDDSPSRDVRSTSEPETWRICLWQP